MAPHSCPCPRPDQNPEPSQGKRWSCAQPRTGGGPPLPGLALASGLAGVLGGTRRGSRGTTEGEGLPPSF